jgi:outer membrane biosynthesis protein TonB
VSVAAAPRLSGGMVASVVLHGGLIAALVILRPGAPRPSAPMFKVALIAAPAGERAAGVVQQPPAAAPEPAPPAPIPTTTKAVVAPKTVAPNAKVKAVPPPKLATPSPTPATKAANPTDAQKKNTPAPTAGGGATGGNGADVANVSTNGIEFPYQPYINNIASQIIRRFQTNGRLTASVRFVIRRDGTVDPDGIRLVETSHNYLFDQAAIGAVEAAAKANAFGALPQSFGEDILPVTFRFTPSLIR